MRYDAIVAGGGAARRRAGRAPAPRRYGPHGTRLLLRARPDRRRRGERGRGPRYGDAAGDGGGGGAGGGRAVSGRRPGARGRGRASAPPPDWSIRSRAWGSYTRTVASSSLPS